MDQRPEADLIRAYRGGEEDALRILIERHLASVYRFLYRLTGDGFLAQDLAQETFVKAWKKLSAFDPTKSFKTWLFAIAKNTAIDELRKKKPYAFSELEREDGPDMAESIVDTQPLVSHMLEREDTARFLEELLSKLSVTARAVVLLHETEDMTFQEIADSLHEPINTVKSRYRRAIFFLRNALQEALVEGKGGGEEALRPDMHQK